MFTTDLPKVGAWFPIDIKTQLKEEKQLNEDKKKAVASQERLMEKIRELRNSNLGLFQTSSQIFKPITEAVDKRNDKQTGHSRQYYQFRKTNT